MAEGADRRTLLLGAISSCALISPGCATLQRVVCVPDENPARQSREIVADLSFIEQQTHLRTGSLGDMRLAERIEDKLTSLGFAIERQPVELAGFEAAACEIRWRDGRTPIEPQLPAAPTGPAGVDGRLVYWRAGDDPSRLEGAIAVIVLAPRRHSRLMSHEVLGPLTEALRGGPRAILIVTDGPTGETIFLNAPDASPAGAIPLGMIGPVPGARLLEAARQGAPATFVVDGRATRLKSWNVLARRHGAGPMLVVSTPRTAWTPAVAERGPGVAAFLRIAEWASRSTGGRELLFVNTTAHEFDNFGGRRFFASEAAPSRSDVALWAHFGAGFAARAHHELGNYRNLPLDAVDPQRFLLGSVKLLPALRSAFAGQPGLSTPYPISEGAAGELEEIAAHGYERVFGLFGAHLRHHVMSDRLPMTDPAWVREAIIAARNAISAIMRL